MFFTICGNLFDILLMQNWCPRHLQYSWFFQIRTPFGSVEILTESHFSLGMYVWCILNDPNAPTTGGFFMSHRGKICRSNYKSRFGSFYRWLIALYNLYGPSHSPPSPHPQFSLYSHFPYRKKKKKKNQRSIPGVKSPNSDNVICVLAIRNEISVSGLYTPPAASPANIGEQFIP